MPLALLIATAVPLHFNPPVDFEKRYHRKLQVTYLIKGQTVHTGHDLDLKIRISGRDGEITAVDTTVLKAKLLMSPYMPHYDRREELERAAVGSVARAMVDPHGGVGKLSVLRGDTGEKGTHMPATIAWNSAANLHAIMLPARFVRVGETWKANYSIQEALAAAGITAPEKMIPVQLTLAEVKDIGGVPHARLKLIAEVETEAEKDGIKAFIRLKDKGEGWFDVKTGLPRRLTLSGDITATGDAPYRARRIITIAAK